MRARGSNAGFLTVEYMGKREQLPASSKGSQISPRLAEVVVKQLDPRWARQGATAALLQAAGYSTDVAVQTEFTVAKVAAPASDPSLRRLPRSIQFQGLRISISVSRSLQKSTSSARPEKLTPQASRHADLPRG
ncbi:hypothetical protein ABBQ38_001300 [Trebouxia sp. C0009 RCD-2024]